MHGGFRPGDLSYVQGWGWGAFYILMGSFLYWGRNLTIAVFVSCLAFGQSPEQSARAAAGAGQQPGASKAGANSNAAQVTITIRGRVVDHVGAVVGGATVLFRAKVAGDCDFENATAEFTAVSNQFGEFWATLRPAVYQVWVQGFHDCVEVAVTPTTPEPLTLKISPAYEVVDESLPESRFQKIAGPAAKNCGRVGIKKDRAPATACAMRAYKHQQAFYVIYDEQGIDSEVAGGIAWNGKDAPYSVSFDGMGLNGDSLWPSSSMPDGSHTIVSRCSKPVRVYVNDEGELDCFRDREMWEQLIERVNRETLLNAGDTGYHELIPALRKRLADTEMGDDPEDKDAVRMALAKLGDREQMQAMVCELHTGSPLEMQTVALEKVFYVGGWYAIRIYRELLTPAAKARFERARLREQGDLALSEPRWWALSSLLKVAPYPSPPGIDYGFNLAQMPEYSQIWLAWIAKNEGKLKKLQPTGNGVDFSGKPCQSIRHYLKQQN
ncbi:MAG: hypothetical protein JWM08_969 [Candidatus Angelobacter sp.]|nr:hypothetical protein [Candidatus Angelobacter sp.]